MIPRLFNYQKIAINQLKTGSILCGGVGSGKTLTSLVYYYTKECGGIFDDDTGVISKMKNPKNLYIITTANKRDTLDWQKESSFFNLDNLLTVDSWNNIKKYTNVKNAFFIFDEQRLVGFGAWVKSFLQIAKNNNWILLSATPGDTWMDYIPVFIANGFYKNRTHFIREHVVWNTFIKFPKVDHYIEIKKLQRLKNFITVLMDYETPTKIEVINILVNYDKEKLKMVLNRWSPFTNKPIKDISEYCYTMRKVVNSDLSRLEKIKELIIKHRKIIIFYNFNYELEILRSLNNEFTIAEYNGHKHEIIPSTEQWIYLVQYISGAEGWNCILTNVVVFYSLNYSYRIMTQAAGRIDRLNTPYTTLFYYYIKSSSPIDNAISLALQNKENFNEKNFFNRKSH